MASRCVAYALCLFLGCLGAHQFYLGRQLHGLLMLCTCGGFLVGWLHDLIWLDCYLREEADDIFSDDWQRRYRRLKRLQQPQQAAEEAEEAEQQQQQQQQQQQEEEEEESGNEDGEAAPTAGSGDEVRVRQLRKELLRRSPIFREMRRRSTPRCSWSRYFGEALFGNICSTLWLCLWPPEWYEANDYRLSVINCTWTIPIAFGVWLVGNVGTQQLRFSRVLLCSLACLLVYSTDYTQSFYGSLLTATLANWFSRSWRDPESLGRRRQRRRVGRCRQAASTACAAALFFVLAAYCLLNSARVTYDGESVPLRQALKNFFKSPLWKEMQGTVGKLYEYYTIHGFKDLLKELWDALDPQGLKDASSVLGLSESASAEEIRRRCKKLKIQYHPDRQKEPSLKAEYQAKFQEVSAACDTLNSDRRRSPRRRDQSDL